MDGADTIVVGGGTAGAVIAARLASSSPERVLLVEAGPDYGPKSSTLWPRELLDFCGMPADSHTWGYRSAARNGLPGFELSRARVIGGCSSHNGCAAVWGHRRDYDGWAASGNEGWDAGCQMKRYYLLILNTASNLLFGIVHGLEERRVDLPMQNHRGCFQDGGGAACR